MIATHKALAVAVFGLKCLVGVLGVLALALAAYPENAPTSGAVLTIKDAGGNIIVNIYDSQIHSGLVQLSPCDPTGFKTDAYVMQGGSTTGCNPVDLYEITDVATSTTTFTPRTDTATHQAPGSVDIAGFHIETHFICVGKCATGVTTKEKTFCNTAGTILINVLY